MGTTNEELLKLLDGGNMPTKEVPLSDNERMLQKAEQSEGVPAVEPEVAEESNGTVGGFAESFGRGALNTYNSMADMAKTVTPEGQVDLINRGSDYVAKKLGYEGWIGEDETADLTPLETVDAGINGTFSAMGIDATSNLYGLTQRASEKGENRTNDTGYVMGEWFSPMGGGAKAGKLIDHGGDVARNHIIGSPWYKKMFGKGKEVANKLTPNKLDVTMSAGAGAGSQFDVEGKIGEYTGGFTPAVAAVALAIRNGRKVDSNAIKTVEMAIESLGNNASPKGVELQKLLDDVMAKAENGEKGTFFALSGYDKGIGNLEARAARDAEYQTVIAKKDAEFAEDTISKLDEVGGVTSSEVSEHIRPTLKADEGAINSERAAKDIASDTKYQNEVMDAYDNASTAGKASADADKAFTQAEAKLSGDTNTRTASADALQPSGSTADASKEVVEVHGKKAKEAKAVVDAKWDVYTGSKPISTSVISNARQVFEKLTNTKIGLVRGDYKKAIEYLENAMNEGKVTPDDLSTFISMVKQQKFGSGNSTKGFKESDKVMSQFVDEVEKTLKGMGSTGKAYEDAVSTSKKYFDTFKNRPLQKSISGSKFKEGEVMSSGMSGDAGATFRDDLYELAKGAPEVTKIVEEALKHKAVGNLDKTFARSFIDSHSEILRAYPELKDKLVKLSDLDISIAGQKTNVASLKKTKELSNTAKAKADEVHLNATDAEKAGTPANRKGSRLAKSKAVADAKHNKLKGSNTALAVNQTNTVIKDILNPNSNYTVRQAKEFVDNLDNIAGAKDKFRRGIVDHLVNASRKVGSDGAEVGSDIATSIANGKPKLLESGAFTPDEMAGLEALVDRTFLKDRRALGRAGNVRKTELSLLQRTMSGIIGSTAAGSMPVGSALVLTGLFRRVAQGEMKFKGMETAESIALLNKILTNPKLLTNTDALKAAADSGQRLEAVRRMYKSGATLTRATAVYNNDQRAKEQEKK